MKIIKSFSLDTNDIGSGGEERMLMINADKGAVFSMEIMNEENKYYNFQTNLFQTVKTRLSDVSVGALWRKKVIFPPVTDADKYTIYVFAEKDTKHADYAEVRFADGTLDINSTTGSNSILLQKTIYQTLDTTITINSYSPNGAITGTATPTSITASNGKGSVKVPFQFHFTTGSTNTVSVNRQPVKSDFMTFVTSTVGDPISIPGENVYPSITGTGTVAGSAGLSEAVTMATDIASYVKDGDRVTGTAALDAATVTVASIVSSRTFRLSQAMSIGDGVELDFSNSRNYRWALENIHGLAPGMSALKGPFFTNTPKIKQYLTQTTIFENEIGEYKVDDVRIPALDTLGAKPSIVRDAITFVETTTQTGNVVFSEQARHIFKGTSAKTFAYGQSEIQRLTGYDVEFSDLSVELKRASTTTTSAPSASTTFNVTSAVGIADDISVVSGIGIDSSVENPTVTSITNIGGGTWDNTGQATLTLSAAQTLESGITLNFDGASRVATVTGYIKVNRASASDVILLIDLEKFLTMH